MQNGKKSINPLRRVAFHIKTGRLICSENEMPGFCVKCNTELKCVKHWAEMS